MFVYVCMFVLSIDKIFKIKLLIVVSSQQENNAMYESELEFFMCIRRHFFPNKDHFFYNIKIIEIRMIKIIY